MEGQCRFTGSMPIQQIIDATPKGQHAMFEIISSENDFEVGDVVRITKNDKVINMMTDEEVFGVKAEDLKFLRYGDLS